MVAARLAIATYGAGAFDVAIGEKTSLGFGIQLLLLLQIQVFPLAQPQEEILRDTVMIFGVGMSEEVITDADGLLSLEEPLVEMLEELPRGLVLHVRFDRDGSAVRIRARYHQHLVSLQAVVTRKDVGREVSPRQMSDV